MSSFDQISPFLVMPVALLSVAELVLLFMAPSWFARAAVFSAGLDRVLTVPVGRVGTRLVDGRERDGEYDFAWDGARGHAWVRPTFKFFGFNRSMAIGRVEVRVEQRAGSGSPFRDQAPPEERVEVRVRWLPLPISMFAMFAVLGAGFTLAGQEAGLAIFAVMVFAGAVNAAFCYARVKPGLSMVADHVETLLTREGPPPRAFGDPLF